MQAPYLRAALAASRTHIRVESNLAIREILDSMTWRHVPIAASLLRDWGASLKAKSEATEADAWNPARWLDDDMHKMGSRVWYDKNARWCWVVTLLCIALSHVTYHY